MDSGSSVAALVVAVVVVVLVSAALQWLFAIWLKRGLLRELSTRSGGPAAGSQASDESGGAERFAEVAADVVTLARAAANAAIRNEEVHEWHQLDLFALGADDISETIRDRVRRAAFDAVAARSAFFVALRRHGAAIPVPLETELRAFGQQLDRDESGTRAERKRKIVAELDAVEARIREALGADRFAE